MSDTDTYRTLAGESEGLYKEKGSKFIAYAHPITEEADIKPLIEQTKATHHASRHCCYAWRLGADGARYRANDDGEPSSSAGKPILGQIDSNELTNVLVMVIRYFGGTKLGVSGLIGAYRAAAADALQAATIKECTVMSVFEVHFEYPLMNEVMRAVKERNAKVLVQDFAESCRLEVAIRKNDTELLQSRLEKIVNLEVDYLRTE